MSAALKVGEKQTREAKARIQGYEDKMKALLPNLNAQLAAKPEDLECSLCCLMVNEPVTCIECDHTYCRKCIDNLIAQYCPKCRTDFSVKPYMTVSRR